MKISPQLWSSCWVGLALLARIASGPTANASFVLLAVYALFGRVQAVQALALTWLFSMLNPGIFPVASQGSVGRYLVFGSAAVSIFLRADFRREPLKFSTPVLATIGVGCFFVLHSVLFSPIPDVSILKALSWTVVMVTLVSAWQALSGWQRSRLERQIFWALVGVMGLSVALMAVPAGYMDRGELRGLLGHSQALGPSMGFLAAWSGCKLIVTRRPPWLMVGVFAGAVALVVLSGARTAGLGFLAGMVVAVSAVVSRSPHSVRTLFPGLRSRRTGVLLLLSTVALVLLAPRLGNVVGDFITKSGDDTMNIVAVYDQSRGRLIEDMWANIEKHPFGGVGFGIASDVRDMTVQRDPVLGLPVGATIEKGVMPVAVLEEIGVFGFVLVGAWILLVFRRSLRAGLEATAIVATALLLNFGEATLFSAGGMGLLSLILIAWALSHRAGAGREIPG